MNSRKIYTQTSLTQINLKTLQKKIQTAFWFYSIPCSTNSFRQLKMQV